MPSPELLATAYGLCTAASWGSGDFCGGLASRRMDYRGVAVVSQFLGAALLLVLAVALRAAVPSRLDLFLGCLAGILGGFGLMALYRGLALDAMGVVAPVAALVTALVPVCWATLRDGPPPWEKVLAFALALAAVWLLSGGGTGAGFTWRSIRLPLAAGLGFGSLLILLEAATKTAILWPLVAARASSGVVLFAVLGMLGANMRIPPTLAAALPVAAAGVCDVTGNMCFALAARVGRLDLAAVVVSLYPAFTVLWAWIALKERLKRGQWVGVALALVALVLIAW